LEQENQEKNRDLLSLKESFVLILVGFLSATALTLLMSDFESKLHLILGEIVFVAPLLGYFVVKKIKVAQAGRLAPCSFGTVLISVVIGAVAAVLTDEVDRVVTRFIAIPPEFEQLTTEMVQVDNLLQGVVVVVAVVLLASVFEELLFRGVLQQALESRLDTTNAVLLTAFIFSFFHPPQWIIQVLLLGILLSYLAWRSGSILPGIIVHSVNNGFAILFGNTAWQSWEWYNWHGHVNPPVLAVAACVLFYGLLFFNKQQRPLQAPA